MRIGVFCSSSQDVSDNISETASALGAFIGDNKHELVYGGVNSGLMHTVALAARQHGAQVIGVVPGDMRRNIDECVTQLNVVNTISSRKRMMYDLSDIFVVLPGGIGTLDELFTLLSNIQLNVIKTKPIIVVNVEGVYDNLKSLLEKLSAAHLLRSNASDNIIYVSNISECIEHITADKK